jgi:hypothetical protein
MNPSIFTKIQKKDMKKKYYSQIHVDKYGSSQKFTEYSNMVWNPTQQDDDRKWKLGAKRLRDTHLELFNALIVLLIKKTIAPQNGVNKLKSGAGVVPFNIEKNLFLKAEPYEIQAIMLRGLKQAFSLQTIKNRLTRMEDAGIINRKWLRSEGKFSIEINSDLLKIKCPITETVIKNIDFSNTSKPIVSENKNEKFTNNTNKTNNKNKKIQGNPVDKMNLHTEINKSKKHFTSEKQKQTVHNSSEQTDENTKSSDLHKNSLINAKNNVATSRNKDKNTDSVFFRAKKKVALAFYKVFILTFWEHARHLYLPEEAPINFMHFIEQSLDTIMNDNDYLGACKNNETLHYQAIKMSQAIKSTRDFIASKKKYNPSYNIDYLYPNLFLKHPAEKNRMSFKNAMLHIESFMFIKEQRDEAIEKKMQKEREKDNKEKGNLIINNLISFIYLNTKLKTKDLILCADQYLVENHPKLVHQFHADVKNSYSIKKAKEWRKNNEYDKFLLQKCFNSAKIIEAEINKLLPELHKKLKSGKAGISNKMHVYFTFAGSDWNAKPKAYNNTTLRYLQNYMR